MFKLNNYNLNVKYLNVCIIYKEVLVDMQTCPIQMYGLGVTFT